MTWRTRPVVLYTDPPWAVGPDGGEDRARATVEDEAFEDRVDLRLVPRRAGRYVTEGSEFLAAVAEASALVIHRCEITREILEAGRERLRVVARQGVGVDNLHRELLDEYGVVGFNVPDYCVDEVATHTLALALACERHLIPQHRSLRAGRFDIYAGGMPRRLRRCVAGIVGFGRIGRAVAQRLRVVYGRVVATDPYVSGDLMEGYGVEKAELDDLLRQSDAVFLHCALTPETRGLIDEATLARMKPGAVLVNAARGALVRGQALHGALTRGRLGGAGLDVFSPEDPYDDEWWARVVVLDNVVATSHRAFLSAESEWSQRYRAAAGVVEAIESGRAPAWGRLPDELAPTRQAEAAQEVAP